MPRAPRTPPSSPAGAVVAAAVATAAFGALAACNAFSPAVGAELAPICMPGDASDPAANGYGGTGGYATPPAGCGDASVDAPTNTVVAGAGVTGNVVIADQNNNRVIIVNRDGELLWQFGDGSQAPSVHSVVAPNDAEFLPATNEVLMVGTGGPESGCPAAGCVDNRVLIVDYTTKLPTWTFRGTEGGGKLPLSGPTAARLIGAKDGRAHVLITDQGNNRVIEVEREGFAQVWAYPGDTATRCDGGAGGSAGALTAPQSAERLANGNTLIADQGANRVIEITPCGDVAWSYDVGLNTPSAAGRLPGPGNDTLIADTVNNRLIEVDHASPAHIVWTFDSAKAPPGLGAATTYGAATITGGVRLLNGHTLITEQSANVVLEVDHESPPNLVYAHGVRGVAGAGPGELSYPYNAKVMGQALGLTNPF